MRHLLVTPVGWATTWMEILAEKANVLLREPEKLMHSVNVTALQATLEANAITAWKETLVTLVLSAKRDSSWITMGFVMKVNVVFWVPKSNPPTELVFAK